MAFRWEMPKEEAKLSLSMVKERGKTDMGQIDIYKNQDAACILIEPEAYEGVRRIGARVAQDMELVTAHRPKLEEHAAGIQGTRDCFPSDRKGT